MCFSDVEWCECFKLVCVIGVGWCVCCRLVCFSDVESCECFKLVFVIGLGWCVCCRLVCFTDVEWCECCKLVCVCVIIRWYVCCRLVCFSDVEWCVCRCRLLFLAQFCSYLCRSPTAGGLIALSVPRSCGNRSSSSSPLMNAVSRTLCGICGGRIDCWRDFSHILRSTPWQSEKP